MDELEIWSCIKNGFEGLYEASNKGRLKSLRHKNEKKKVLPLGINVHTSQIQ